MSEGQPWPNSKELCRLNDFVLNDWRPKLVDKELKKPFRLWASTQWERRLELAVAIIRPTKKSAGIAVAELTKRVAVAMWLVTVRLFVNINIGRFIIKYAEESHNSCWLPPPQRLDRLRHPDRSSTITELKWEELVRLPLTFRFTILEIIQKHLVLSSNPLPAQLLMSTNQIIFRL